MGVVGGSDMRIDLHGLSVEAAKQKLVENIFPAMPVLERVVIITGRGLHAKSGKSVLKEEIKVFCREKKFTVHDVQHNPGAMYMCLWGSPPPK